MSWVLGNISCDLDLGVKVKECIDQKRVFAMVYHRLKSIVCFCFQTDRVHKHKTGLSVSR